METSVPSPPPPNVADTDHSDNADPIDISTVAQDLRHFYELAEEAFESGDYEKANDLAGFVVKDIRAGPVAIAGCHTILSHAPSMGEDQINHAKDALEIYEWLAKKQPPSGPKRDNVNTCIRCAKAALQDAEEYYHKVVESKSHMTQEEQENEFLQKVADAVCRDLQDEFNLPDSAVFVDGYRPFGDRNVEDNFEGNMAKDIQKSVKNKVGNIVENNVKGNAKAQLEGHPSENKAGAARTGGRQPLQTHWMRERATGDSGSNSGDGHLTRKRTKIGAGGWHSGHKGHEKTIRTEERGN